MKLEQGDKSDIVNHWTRFRSMVVVAIRKKNATTISYQECELSACTVLSGNCCRPGVDRMQTDQFIRRDITANLAVTEAVFLVSRSVRSICPESIAYTAWHVREWISFIPKLFGFVCPDGVTNIGFELGASAPPSPKKCIIVMYSRPLILHVIRNVFSCEKKCFHVALNVWRAKLVERDHYRVLWKRPVVFVPRGVTCK